jgi:hypothetical protein
MLDASPFPLLALPALVVLVTICTMSARLRAKSQFCPYLDQN